MTTGIRNVLTVDGRRKAATTSVGSVFQMCGAATAKARLPTVDSLTGGTTRRLAFVERSIRRPGKSSGGGKSGLSCVMATKRLSISHTGRTGLARTNSGKDYC